MELGDSATPAPAGSPADVLARVGRDAVGSVQTDLEVEGGVRRRRTNNNRPREKRTLIPSFDPEELARELEGEANRTTVAPPFDPSAYARIVDERGLVAVESRATPRAMAAADPVAPGTLDAEWRRAAARETPTSRPNTAFATEDTVDLDNPETAGREMYGCYLASDFPAALVLAERVLALQPDHALARLVLDRCHERLTPAARTLSPSSVLRLKMAELERQSMHIDATSSFVLGHIDGISDAATVAALTGLPNMEALQRLHALVDLGVLEVVSA